MERMIVSDKVLAAGPFGFRTAIELHPGKSKIRLRNKAYNGPFLFMLKLLPSILLLLTLNINLYI